MKGFLASGGIKVSPLPDKKEEAAAALDAAKRTERKQKILEALEKVEGSELAAKSKEELLAELSKL